MTSRTLARVMAESAIERRATDVVVLDLRPLKAAADFFVLCTVDNDTQAKAVADHVTETARTAGEKPWHVEGRNSIAWVLVDCVTVVTHIFLNENRTFYNLERLWRDATIYDVIDKGKTISWVKRAEEPAIPKKSVAAKAKPKKKTGPAAKKAVAKKPAGKKVSK